MAKSSGSWWYVFCMKCRQKEVGPGWEPNFWPRLCPHPFCPAYRQFARIVALFVIGLLIWSFAFFVIGTEAAPGGQLFNIALLCLTAHFVGWFFRIVTLPSLLGMLITGIVFQNIGLISISPEYGKMTSLLRKVALVVLLTRAGLDLDPEALKKLYLRVITLGLVPWTLEAVMMALLAHYFLFLPWLWAMLLGCIIGAVAPAVVVPCLFRLRNKGYGVVKGIPTLIIAVAGINDGLSVAFFGLFHSIMFSHHSLVYDLFIGPMSIAVGLGFGAVWGIFAKYIPEGDDPFVVPLRVLMLFFGGVVAVFGSEACGFEGAGPLGVISAAFVSIYCWSHQGWNIEDNPVATAFEIFWMLCEPILFSLTGAQVVLNELQLDTVIHGAAFILICFVARVAFTMLIAAGSSLNTKEKLFVALSWMSKASVQAVLAPAALESVRKAGKDKEADLPHADKLVTICIMAMLITVPIGAISITSLGTRLLTKTKQVVPVEGWRRSARPSLRDITIIDEEVENYDTDDNETEKNNGKLHLSSDNEQDLNDVTTPVFTHVN
ncbi:sodium/hydrogen exchanger 9B2-like isoform X2 [Planococcus citri]|uniref:sodium/hydrogen exchanger 9B2-like isoform X2 n=1 Tax=Planococcus citri TaxID=170843 RepID=UPI0031F7CBE0